MGPGTIAVQVASKAGMPRYRGDRMWPASWTEALVDEELLELLKADAFLQVRTLTGWDAVERKTALLADAEVKASAARAHAEQLEQHVKSLREDLDAERARLGNAERPAPEPAPTPVKDAREAATPAAMKAQPLAPSPAPNAKRARA